MKRRYGRKSLKQRSKRPKRAYKKASKGFKKAVQKIISANVETKCLYGNFTLTGFNSGINSQADVCGILNSMPKGTMNGHRIGDQVRAQRCYVKGHMVLSHTNRSYDNVRIAVRLLCVQPKSFHNAVVAANEYASWVTGLLKKGPDNVGFAGTLSDLYAEMNTDMVTVIYDKIHYLSIDLGINNPADNWGFQNTRQTIKFFKIRIPCKNKLLKFDANIDNGYTPTNWGPVMLMGYSKLSGAAADTTETQVYMVYDSYLHYEDA